MPAPTHKPTPIRDLSDAELRELDELLAATPEPLQPLDIVMLEGYLCGVLVQPVLLDAGQWLAPIFDLDATPLPASIDPTWLDRISVLIRRHHAALNHRLVDEGWFDPLVFEAAASDAETPTETPTGSDAEAALESPAYPPLWPWVVGFQYAMLQFPALGEVADDEVSATLDRVFRHLPAQTDEERQDVARIDAEHPLASLDDAIEVLVNNVVALFDLTHAARYKVDGVKRDQPKVGRNDPCPCGSGRKFKQCHGA